MSSGVVSGFASGEALAMASGEVAPDRHSESCPCAVQVGQEHLQCACGGSLLCWEHVLFRGLQECGWYHVARVMNSAGAVESNWLLVAVRSVHGPPQQFLTSDIATVPKPSALRRGCCRRESHCLLGR